MSVVERRDRGNLGQLLVIGFLSVAMLMYIGLIGAWAWMIARRGGGANLGLAAGMVLVGLVGLWILWSVLSNGYAHQKLAASAKAVPKLPGVPPVMNHRRVTARSPADGSLHHRG